MIDFRSSLHICKRSAAFVVPYCSLYNFLQGQKQREETLYSPPPRRRKKLTTTRLLSLFQLLTLCSIPSVILLLLCGTLEVSRASEMNKTFNTCTLLAPSTFSAFLLKGQCYEMDNFKHFYQYLLCMLCIKNAQELTGQRRLPI